MPPAYFNFNKLNFIIIEESKQDNLKIHLKSDSGLLEINYKTLDNLYIEVY